MVKSVEDSFTHGKRSDLPGTRLVELSGPASGPDHDRSFHARGLAGKQIGPGVADHPGGS